MRLWSSESKTWNPSDSRKEKGNANKLPVPSDTFHLPFYFLWVAILQSWAIRSVKAAQASTSNLCHRQLGLVFPWERGSQVLENSVGTTLSFSYFKMESRASEKHFETDGSPSRQPQSLISRLVRGLHLVQNLWKPQPARHGLPYPHWPQQQNNLWFSNLRGLFWHSSSFF